MKTNIKNRFLLPTLIAALALLPARPAAAQTFTTLHSFTPVVSSTNSDGAIPYAGLVLAGNTLYGTAVIGGTYGGGTVYAINADGTGFITLYSFPAAPGGGPNSVGAFPYGGLVLSGNTLYGTAEEGGIDRNGTVFAITTNSVNGAGFRLVYTLTGGTADGGFPTAGLVVSGDVLYGTATTGGSAYDGTAFAVTTNGTILPVLHSFSGGSGGGDGSSPAGGLVLSGNTVYGTTPTGGSPGVGDGTVFSVNTGNTGYSILHTFAAEGYNGAYTNGDGANPYAGLVLSGGTLYGTANAGGTNGNGTIFSVTTGGTFKVLHTFLKVSGSYQHLTNSDGINPQGGLIISGNTLYGTASAGGAGGSGTVFSINTDGTGFTTLYSFTPAPYPEPNSDGANPYGSLVLSNYTIYGTTTTAGNSGNGTVFSLSFLPKLTIILSGTNAILSWPANFAGFDYAGFVLQSATNLVSPDWTTISGQNTVTNPIAGTQMFYRLSQ
jgi:uncharacterized repeat protein (TIGR03803 family)